MKRLPMRKIREALRLRADGFSGRRVAEAFAEMQSQDGAANLTHAEWLGLLIDKESSSRETRRFESRMRTARLRHVGASPEDVDYKTRRGLDKALFQKMLTGRWIRDKRNLMITGPCGVGKTWLAYPTNGAIFATLLPTISGSFLSRNTS